MVVSDETCPSLCRSAIAELATTSDSALLVDPGSRRRRVFPKAFPESMYAGVTAMHVIAMAVPCAMQDRWFARRGSA